MNRFTRWIKNQLTSSVTKREHVCHVQESHAILCEAFHEVVRIPGFVGSSQGNGETCPHCGNADPTRLKYVAAWLRTGGEQTTHWAGRQVKMPTTTHALHPARTERPLTLGENTLAVMTEFREKK